MVGFTYITPPKPIAPTVFPGLSSPLQTAALLGQFGQLSIPQQLTSHVIGPVRQQPVWMDAVNRRQSTWGLINAVEAQKTEAALVSAQSQLAATQAELRASHTEINLLRSALGLQPAPLPSVLVPELLTNTAARTYVQRPRATGIGAPTPTIPVKRYAAPKGIGAPDVVAKPAFQPQLRATGIGAPSPVVLKKADPVTVVAALMSEPLNQTEAYSLTPAVKSELINNTATLTSALFALSLDTDFLNNLLLETTSDTTKGQTIRSASLRMGVKKGSTRDTQNLTQTAIRKTQVQGALYRLIDFLRRAPQILQASAVQKLLPVFQTLNLARAFLTQFNSEQINTVYTKQQLSTFIVATLLEAPAKAQTSPVTSVARPSLFTPQADRQSWFMTFGTTAEPDMDSSGSFGSLGIENVEGGRTNSDGGGNEDQSQHGQPSS